MHGSFGYGVCLVGTLGKLVFDLDRPNEIVRSIRDEQLWNRYPLEIINRTCVG